jgi:hypothetical protein
LRMYSKLGRVRQTLQMSIREAFVYIISYFFVGIIIKECP